MFVKIAVPSATAGKRGEWWHVNPSQIVRIRQNLDTGKFYIRISGDGEFEITEQEWAALRGPAPLGG